MNEFSRTTNEINEANEIRTRQFRVIGKVSSKLGFADALPDFPTTHSSVSKGFGRLMSEAFLKTERTVRRSTK